MCEQAQRNSRALRLQPIAAMLAQGVYFTATASVMR